MNRDYELVQHVRSDMDRMIPGERLIPGDAYHISPAEWSPIEGKSWVWKEGHGISQLLAGPFDSNEEGLAWVAKLISPQTAENMALTHAPRAARHREVSTV